MREEHAEQQVYRQNLAQGIANAGNALHGSDSGNGFDPTQMGSYANPVLVHVVAWLSWLAASHFC